MNESRTTGTPKAAPRTTAIPAARAAAPEPKLVGFSSPEVVRHEAAPTIELSRNAKGEASWTIKMSAPPGVGLDAVLADVLTIDRRLLGETKREEDGSG